MVPYFLVLHPFLQKIALNLKNQVIFHASVNQANNGCNHKIVFTFGLKTIKITLRNSHQASFIEFVERVWSTAFIITLSITLI